VPALEYFQRALAIMKAENPPPTVAIARLVANIGSLYADRGDNARALQHFRRSLLMLGPDQEPVTRAVMLQNMAWIYEIAGRGCTRSGLRQPGVGAGQENR